MDRLSETTSDETVAIPAIDAGAAALSHISHTTSIPDEGRFISGTLLAGRYRIVGLLGKGGMGEVYRATDLALGQSVALKFLPAAAAENPVLLERFHGEVRVARQVSHPNVCRVYDIGQTEGMPFLSMEYVDGEDLASLIPRIGRLPADKAIDTARRICAGLAAAHSKGVIHRDLKPHNIMMNRRGEILIMDFGLAAIASQLAGPEARNGTPAYMSPEQLKGTEVTARSDIYALGLVLYELFTGRRPYNATTIRQLIAQQEAAQLTSMSSIAADIDPAVEQVVRRCLDPDPAKRPESALVVSLGLPGGDPLAAALAAGETPSPELVAASGATEGMAPRRALLCLGIVLLCVFATPWIKQQEVAFFQTPGSYPPDVLRQKAREIAASFGYEKTPADTWLTLNQRLELVTFLDLRRPPRDWKNWLASEAPTAGLYRESLAPMVAKPAGDVGRQNPPLTEPGMVTVELDGAGRLRGFAAMPYGNAAVAVSPETVFRAAQLDPAKFTEVAPQSVPGTASDVVRAWKGPHPGIAGLDLTLEMAFWKGRVTEFVVRWPWARNAAPKLNPVAAEARDIGEAVTIGVGLLFAILLARRNWKQQRGDRRGAFAVALAQFLLAMLTWVGSVHAVASGAMIGVFFEAVSDAAFYGLLFLILYLALEPALRARWPHSIITWNRVLTGKWRDAQVGAHVLRGAAAGMGLFTANSLLSVFSIEKYGLNTMGGLSLLISSRVWIGGMAARLDEAVKLGLIVFFAIFGLRVLLRRDWLAAIVGAIIFASLEGDLANALDLRLELAVFIVLYTALIFMMLRIGLVATISAVFFFNALNGMTLDTDWTTWYAPTGFATMALIFGITLVAFRQALGNKSVLQM